MNNKIIFSVAIIGLALTSSAVFASCCSHSVTNESGKNLTEVRFECHNCRVSGEEWRTFNKQRNIRVGEKRNFTTDQIKRTIENPLGRVVPINHIVVIHGKRGDRDFNEVRTEKNWMEGNRNWIIKPDLTVKLAGEQ